MTSQAYSSATTHNIILLRSWFWRKTWNFFALTFLGQIAFTLLDDLLRVFQLFLWILLSRVICDRVRSNTAVPCVLFGSNWWKQITVPVRVNIWCCNNISVLRSIYFSCKYSAITSINSIKINLLKHLWIFSMAIKKATGPAFEKRLRCNHLLSALWFRSVWICFYFSLMYLT